MLWTRWTGWTTPRRTRPDGEPVPEAADAEGIDDALAALGIGMDDPQAESEDASDPLMGLSLDLDMTMDLDTLALPDLSADLSGDDDGTAPEEAAAYAEGDAALPDAVHGQLWGISAPAHDTDEASAANASTLLPDTINLGLAPPAAGDFRLVERERGRDADRAGRDAYAGFRCPPGNGLGKNHAGNRGRLAGLDHRAGFD